MDVLEERFDTVRLEQTPPPGSTIAMRPLMGGDWHTNHDCPRLARTRSVRVYPLAAAMRLSTFYSAPCDFCVPEKEVLREVVQQHDEEIGTLDDYLRG